MGGEPRPLPLQLRPGPVPPPQGGRGRRADGSHLFGKQRLILGEREQANIARSRQQGRKFGSRGIVEENPRAAVGKDGRQLYRGLAPVERHQDRAGLAAREQQLEERRRVVREDGHALARRDTDPLERRRTPLGPVVEGRERDPAAGIGLLESNGVG